MKKTQLTFLQKAIRSMLLIVTVMLVYTTSSFSQCSLGCNSNVQVSLDNANCQAVITPQMMLGTIPPTSCPSGSFIVEVRFNGVIVPSATVTHEHVGKVLEAKVIDINSGNSCWGYLHIEDKLPPVIICEDPDDISCFEVDNYEPTVIENCGSYVLQITSEAVTNNTCSNGLPSNVLKVVSRTYVAIDKAGNRSLPCTIEFDVLAIDDLSDIDAPSNFLYPSSNLQCDGTWVRDTNGNPHPSHTGVPQLDGSALWPNPSTACNILVDYRDQRLPAIGCVTKIMRTWTIVEWSCITPQRTRTILQMIEIADTKGPSITGEKDITVSTTPHKCEAVVNVPAVTVRDNCSGANQITVTISGGTPLINGNGGTTTLPIGYHTLVYRATDACGNSTEKSINVWVEDLTPPVAVCDQNTVVGLTSDGTAWVHASSFDNGSYDECQLSKMLVKRMDATPCGNCKEPEFAGFHYLGSRDGHYYYVSSHPYVGRLAFKHAKAMGGYAVSLETAAEANWLSGQLALHHKDDCYTVGLNIDYQNSNYRWESGSLHIPGTIPGFPYIGSTIDPNDEYVCIGQSGYSYLDNSTPRNYIVEITDPCGFSSYAKFCCDDIPNNTMVQFRVIDANCNWNDCMVNVTTQDKLPPSITCPSNLTVNCDTPFSLNNLSASFGTAIAYDNCSVTIKDTTTLVNINQCNVGSIVRTFRATDAGGRVAQCNQTINFMQTDPFNVNVTNPFDPTDDIDWPTDVTMNGCDDPTSSEFLPVNTGRPVLHDGVCQLVGVDYHDQIFTFNNTSGNSCFKILRTWTVIDWCQFINGQYYTVSYTQVIKVNNTVAPIIRSSCASKEVCTYDPTCVDGYIELTASATDDCTRGLKWYAKIDINNNGSFESGLSKSGTGTSASVQNPTIADASGSYPVGTHRIVWTFEDKCGNLTSCDQIFTIANCKAATPYLLNGLSVDLMPQDPDGDGDIDGGMVEIWASDFDRGSSHPCGYKILFSFSPNVDDKNKIFTCSNKGRQNVTIYTSVITPMGDTIRSWANTFIDVQDNMKACPTTGNSGKVAITGKVMTEAQEGVENATLVLQSNEQMLSASNNVGAYKFPDMPTGGDYVLSGVKTDDYLNGVSTLDLVLIQRHVLGIEKISSPYLLISADVNKDKKITASDLVELRKLILGITDKLASNDSWRFIDKGFAFADPNNAHAGEIKETYEINSLAADMNIDFVAVKVGDVNKSAAASAAGVAAESRSNKVLSLVANVTEFAKGDLVNLALKAEEVTRLSGMQFTLKYDPAVADVKNIEGTEININDNNIGWTRSGEGIITFSWNKDNAVDVNEIMNIQFIAGKDGNTADLFAVVSDVTAAEAYNEDMEIMDVKLRSIGEVDGYALYQNTPNPFSTTTNIQFRLPNASVVNLKVYDVTGKVLKQINKEFSAGMNTVTLDKTQLGQSGVLYYQIEAGEFAATRKMVVIE